VNWRTRRKAGERGPEKVGKLLGSLLDEAGIRADLDRQSALSRWEPSVGEKIADVTNARSVAEGTLVVEVRSSAWLMELNMMKGEILARLNADLDTEIERLVFVLSPTG